jgi:fructokinase
MAAVIVVAGEALIDLILHPDGHLSAVPGGGPFNAARTIGRLGGEVAFVGRLSDDRFGGALRAALERDGVDLRFAEATTSPTTLAVAELDDRGAATYRFHTAETAAPELGAAAIARAFAEAPSAIHLGTLGLVLEPMATALVTGALAADPTTLVLVDPNYRPQVIRDRAAYLARLDRILGRADVVKLSADDLRWMRPGVAAAAVAAEMLAAGASLVIATDGPRPVCVFGRGFGCEVEVPSVDVVDTVGAGDAFGGAFLAWWTERGLGRADLADSEAVREAVGRAVEIASLTCQRAGADPPTRVEAGW